MLSRFDAEPLVEVVVHGSTSWDRLAIHYRACPGCPLLTTMNGATGSISHSIELWS
jgi:hypothetical protein